MIHNVAVFARKLLSGRRRRRYDESLPGKLLPQAFEEPFDRSDFTNGDRMHPDRLPQLRELEISKTIRQRRQVFSKSNQIKRKRESQTQREQQRVCEIHACRRVYFFIWGR